MLESSLRKFLMKNQEKLESNIIYSIVADKFTDIISSQDKYHAHNIIEENLKKYFDGETLELENKLNFDRNLKNLNLERGKIYINKVYIKGIKGFTNIEELCKTRAMGEVAADLEGIHKQCTNQPIITLEGNKSCIIFGWNGEGKSSLTEGVEFGLTRDTVERSRRNRKLNEYLLNTNSEHGQVIIELCQPYKPLKKVRIIREINRKTDSVRVESDDNNDLFIEINSKLTEYEDFFSKHFIERNRIEEFVLSKGQEKKKAYGELLGLEELFNFIKNSLKTYGTLRKSTLFATSKLKQEQFEQKVKHLKIAEEETIKEPDLMLQLEEKSFIANLLELEESDIKPENLFSISVRLQEEYNKQGEYSIKITQITKIINNVNEYLTIIEKIKSKQGRYNENKDYSTLYEFYEKASLVVKEVDNVCPLCGSSNVFGEELIQVINIRLKELSNIRDLIRESSQLNNQKEEIEKSIINELKKVNMNVNIENLLIDALSGELNRSLEELKRRLSDEASNYQGKINIMKNKINLYKTLYDEYKVRINTQKNAIENLNKELKTFEIEAKEEQENNALKIKTLEDYRFFENDLNNYYKNEMAEGLKDINNVIKYYYNKFEPTQQFVNIKFIEDDGGKFLVTYADKIDIDPLTVLSEGQLRCFGLAILLSIAKKVKASFMIMDDIVNAVDIEHRANIVKVLCIEIEKPNNVQLILTTHDKLFREKFVNSVINKNKIKSYTFITSSILQDNDYLNDDTENIIFEYNIEKSIRNKDCRTALIFMRVLLENTVYSIADGKIPITFRNQVYKYRLDSVFAEIAKVNSKVNKIYQYFQQNNKFTWGILNQENHFWSEQSICLDCDIIDEIFKYVIALFYIRAFEQLDENDKRELDTQFELCVPDIRKFDKESKVFGLFIEEEKWSDKFLLLQNILK